MADTPRLHIGEALHYGWDKTTKNFGRFIGVFIVAFVVLIAVNILTFLVPMDDVFLTVVVNVIATLVGILIALGIYRVVLNVSSGKKPELGDLFSFHRFGWYIVASIIVSIGYLLVLGVSLIPGGVVAAIESANNADVTSGLIILGLGGVVGVVLIIALNLLWGLFPFVLLDENTHAFRAIGTSWDLVSKHFWSYFGLKVASLIINIIGLLLLGIGLLVTIPLTAMADAYAYRFLSGQKVK
jgi:hypothetical protein